MHICIKKESRVLGTGFKIKVVTFDGGSNCILSTSMILAKKFSNLSPNLRMKFPSFQLHCDYYYYESIMFCKKMNLRTAV